jgi:hypothetical protein
MESASKIMRTSRKLQQVERDFDNYENAMITFQMTENARCVAEENARVHSTRANELHRFHQLTFAADRAKARVRATMDSIQEVELADEDEAVLVKKLQYLTKIAITKKAMADAAETRCAPYLA